MNQDLRNPVPLTLHERAKLVLDYAQKKGYRWHYNWSNDYWSESKAALLIEFTMLQQWFMDKNLILQPTLIDQYDWSQGWGYELSYDNGKAVIYTCEDQGEVDQLHALLAGSEKALNLLP